MKKALASCLITLWALAACTSPGAQINPTYTPTSLPTYATLARTPVPTATAIVTPTEASATQASHPGLPLLIERGEYFSTAGVCSPCHTNLKDDTGADVSIDRMWRAGMMANSARDPYWQASVRAEVMSNPNLGEVIEDGCANCHMPMAQYTAAAMGEKAKVLDQGLLDPAHPLHKLAQDGVSCTLCHQIQPAQREIESSYSGGFVIDTDRPSGEREIYGPYMIEQDQLQIMQAGSGYVPVQSLHLVQTEMCISCHMLYSPTVDETGKIVGEFPEQMVYLEWYYSDYRGERTCQECHMPQVGGGAFIASTSEVLRSPFALHGSVGGNAYMLSILKTFADDTGVTASGEHFDAAIGRVMDQMQNRTATLRIEDPRLVGERLIAEVIIDNLAGHKLPSSFPSRRAWLHLVVQDSQGETIFESGAYEPNGAIVGNDNDVDPLAYEPHYDLIDNGEQVQVYESVFQDTRGRVTTRLLQASAYVKDNRLLPSGFEADIPYLDIAVRGEAAEDENFIGGEDRIRYSAALGSSQGPYTIRVELLYQSIGYRWAENLREFEAPEVERFLGYYQAVPNVPLVIASASTEVSQ